MGNFVVVDLEMCRVPRGLKNSSYRYGTETIQIGAVLVNERFHIMDTFNTYVFPENGWIDDFIERMTGIDREMIKDAPVMEEALHIFMDWIPEGDVKMVSWSKSDKYQILREMKEKKIKNSKLKACLNAWMDCQKHFGNLVDSERDIGLGDALAMSDISREGRAHDGLMDAYNTAMLFCKMNREKEFQFHPIYKKSQGEDVERLKYSLGSLLESLQFVYA